LCYLATVVSRFPLGRLFVQHAADSLVGTRIAWRRGCQLFTSYLQSTWGFDWSNLRFRIQH